MAHLIDKDALVAEIERIKKEECPIDTYEGRNKLFYFERFLSFLDTLEVKEIKLPNPRFPHLNNIVDKVFGTGNLESLEYEEAEQLVLLAKEELLKDLEVKEVDWDKEIKKYSMELAMKENNGDWLKDVITTAKHFFELGLKAQKGE